MRSRIMYIEDKSGSLTGPCRIGLVRFSKTGATLYYGDRAFKSLTGSGFKANYFDQVTGEHFWISGPRRDGADGLYGRVTQPEDVDENVAESYWRDIRGLASTPMAGAKQGNDLKPMSDDRLPFERRNTVEHHGSDTRSAGSAGKGRKAVRVERQLEALRGETATPDAPANSEARISPIGHDVSRGVSRKIPAERGLPARTSAKERAGSPRSVRKS